MKVDGARLSLTSMAEKKEPEELVLEKLGGSQSVAQENLAHSEIETLNELRKRRDGFVQVNELKSVAVALTSQGRSFAMSVNPVRDRCNHSEASSRAANGRTDR